MDMDPTDDPTTGNCYDLFMPFLGAAVPRPLGKQSAREQSEINTIQSRIQRLIYWILHHTNIWKVFCNIW